MFTSLRSVILSAVCFVSALSAADLNLPKIPGANPRNIVFILTDDQRYDTMSFVGHPWIETPNMDRMAAGGAYQPNTFVTTSLCSPSRASFLSGQWSHKHGVLDNSTLLPKDTPIFPQELQKAGYEHDIERNTPIVF